MEPFITATSQNTSAVIAIVVMAVVCFVMLISMTIAWKAFYKKATANRAFVRTGMGATFVFTEGGGFVMPIIHEMVFVSLETVKVPVELMSEGGVLTADNYRVDLKMEFSVRVQPKNEAVLAAARALGEKAESPMEVGKHVHGKLVSVLRETCASKSLPELAKDREGLTRDLTASLKDDLGRDGLELDSVSVVHLDLTEGKIERKLRELEGGAGA